jgi:hypothetical protein
MALEQCRPTLKIMGRVSAALGQFVPGKLVPGKLVSGKLVSGRRIVLGEELSWDELSSIDMLR